MNKKKLTIGLVGVIAALAVAPAFSAFEAYVVNVTARIENALFVHPQSLEYGTVFPQEHFDSQFFISFSQSFSESSQRRVGTVEYAIKQKPKPREDKVAGLGGVLAARDWCHQNIPDPLAQSYDPQDPVWQQYLENCYPTLCPYLSKHPDNSPTPGNDQGLAAFHNPDTEFATGKMVKFNQFGSTINNDPADIWTVDLAVPCFTGECAQDWPQFVTSLNPGADPEEFEAPTDLESEVFGCDLWIEVTDVY